MTQFQTIASGSSGNAALFTCGDTHILIDMGISCRRLVQSLRKAGVEPEQLSGILITHEHADHIQGVATYCKKYTTPIFCTPGTGRQLSYRIAGVEPRLRPVGMGEVFSLGEVEVTVLPTSHDCRESSAYFLETAEGSLGYLTDTGYIPQMTGDQMLGADILLLESNHDEEMVRSGPYPYALKQRILGPEGHLSNALAAGYAAASARAGTGTIILAHLSEENNTPQAALNIVGRALETVDFRGRLEVAPRGELSRPYRMEAVPCSV